MLVTETDRLNKKGNWFALMNDGHMVDLGQCDDFDAADEAVDDYVQETGNKFLGAIWILDSETAVEWAETISRASKTP